MHSFSQAPESILDRALELIGIPGEGFNAALDQLPVPIYLTDAEGYITHFNSACIDFAGRRPVIGQDRWCVSWKLFTDGGEALPHENCPMAEAICERRLVRGASAIAERPDGTRVHFIPYPTPLFAEDGSLKGAVNMLIDVTDAREAQSLHVQANRCRRLARAIGDRETVATLDLLADEYDEQASVLERTQN